MGQPGPAAVEAAVADAHRREWGRVLAATARVARDLDLAEAHHGSLTACPLPTIIPNGCALSLP